MNTEKPLNPAESIELIQRFILKNKEDFKSQSYYFILWGWMVALASIAHFLLIYFQFQASFLPWPVLMTLGGLLTAWHIRKHELKKEVETHSGGFLKHLWMVVGFAFIPAVFFSIYTQTNPSVITLLLAGIGTLITGLTIKFNPMIIGGVLFFCFSLGAIFIDPVNGLLLNGLAIIIGYIIPGYMLSKSK